MKTKLKLLALISALSINAIAATPAESNHGELSIGYASDYFFRGEKVTGESTQIQASLNTNVKVADAFVTAFVNQGLQSIDSYTFAVGLAESYGYVNAKAGWLHREDTPGDARSELFLTLGVDTLLNPSLTVNRDLDDSLTSGEIGLSHSIDVDVADLTISAVYGLNDQLTGDTNYYEIGGSLTRDLGGLLANVDVDYIDAEDADSETVFSVGIGYKF